MMKILFISILLVSCAQVQRDTSPVVRETHGIAISQKSEPTLLGDSSYTTTLRLDRAAHGSTCTLDTAISIGTSVPLEVFYDDMFVTHCKLRPEDP